MYWPTEGYRFIEIQCLPDVHFYCMLCKKSKNISSITVSQGARVNWLERSSSFKPSQIQAQVFHVSIAINYGTLNILDKVHFIDVFFRARHNYDKYLSKFVILLPSFITNCFFYFVTPYVIDQAKISIFLEHVYCSLCRISLRLENSSSFCSFSIWLTIILNSPPTKNCLLP